MRYMLLTLSLLVLPVTGFANDTVVRTEHYKMTKSSPSYTHTTSGYRTGKPANYEDARYQKWASMTSEERDLAKQRNEASYSDWQHYQAARNAQANRSYRHHPDAWQGKTAEEKDKAMQRNSVYERAHPREDGRHHPDTWQGQTAEEKDAIKQRHSVYERSHPTRDGKYHNAKNAAKLSAAEQRKETFRAQELARQRAEAAKRN